MNFFFPFACWLHSLEFISYTDMDEGDNQWICKYKYFDVLWYSLKIEFILSFEFTVPIGYYRETSYSCNPTYIKHTNLERIKYT